MDIQQTIPISMDIIAWITTIEIPILTAVIAYAHRAKNQFEKRLEHIHDDLSVDINSVRSALMNYKLEVAQKYASIAYLRDVEARLTNHLIRIEKKLDGNYHA